MPKVKRIEREEIEIDKRVQRWYAEVSRNSGRSSTAMQLCRDRPELTAEVERRIRVLESFLESWRRTSSGKRRRSVAPADSRVMMTEVLRASLADRYFVEDMIGSGGMGVVFRGHDLELDRPVALKTLLPNRSISRLKKEAKILAKIDSPYVVKIYTFVQLINGLCVLVMELIDGADLSKIMTVNGGQVAEEQALNWMIQTAQGMLAVADKNITHRDLKPSNILIDRSQQARVADFGLATALTESLGSTTTLTGAIMGTIPYMAPEQTESPDVDTRADIYSFGATFYHALTGRFPFEGATAVTLLVQKHTQFPPAPLKINPSISEHTSRMLERCLARSPEDRFQNFQEVLEFLEQPPPPPNLTCKPLWVYKCRSTSDAAGNWNYFFEEMDGRGEWGGTWATRSASSLKSIREKLQVGDLVLAWQSDNDKRWALGLCRVIALPRDGDEVSIELEAVTRFAQPVKLLDHRDEMPAVRAGTLFAQGRVGTIFGATPAEAAEILRVCKVNPTDI